MSAARLDHGVLNIPGRTSGINAELDRHNAAARAAAHAQAKADAAAHRERRAEAKNIVDQWSDLECLRQCIRLTRDLGRTAKQARKRLLSEAHWAPGNILQLAAAKGGAA